MASRPSSFHLPPSITSSLLKNPPEAVPPTDELERLYSELKAAKQRAADRARKADEDLRTIEESMRRMAEKEKGKSKAVEKVKRERDCAYVSMLSPCSFLIVIFPYMSVYDLFIPLGPTTNLAILARKNKSDILNMRSSSDLLNHTPPRGANPFLLWFALYCADDLSHSESGC
jgi:hypothetical protein